MEKNLKEEVKRLLLEKAKIKDISEKTGLHRKTIESLRDQLLLEGYEVNKRHRYGNDIMELVVEMYNGGYQIDEIVRQLGVPKERVLRKLKTDSFSMKQNCFPFDLLIEWDEVTRDLLRKCGAK